jgi:predicted small metal-binding protein
LRAQQRTAAHAKKMHGIETVTPEIAEKVPSVMYEEEA